MDEKSYNISKFSIPLHGLIGGYNIAILYRHGWCFASTMVGHSLFGQFLSSSIPARNLCAISTKSSNCLICIENKSFELSIELIINHFFEIDNTKIYEKNMSRHQINAEKMFGRDIEFHNGSHYVSPLCNPVIPNYKLIDYMTSIDAAKSHYKRLVNRLNRSSTEVVQLYLETFQGEIDRNKFVSLSSEEFNDSEGNYVTSVLVYKPEREKTKLPIGWTLSLKNNHSKDINHKGLSGCNLIKQLLNHIIRLRKK